MKFDWLSMSGDFYSHLLFHFLRNVIDHTTTGVVLEGSDWQVGREV